MTNKILDKFLYKCKKDDMLMICYRKNDGNGGENVGEIQKSSPSVGKAARKQIKRQQKLLNIVERHGLLSVQSLAVMLGVSEMTVRRDLKKLRESTCQFDQKGEDSINDYSLLNAIEYANQQKDRIGKMAASLIAPNDVIAIDTGSTTARILPYLPDDKNLTVVCYNANVMLGLRHKAGMQIMFCGGIYHLNTEMFEGEEGIQFIRRIRINKAFLSAAGVHNELGITCANTYEVPTKQAVIASSAQKILLADSSKFGKLRSAYFCDLDDIDTVITDSSLTEERREEITEHENITLHLV